jgi:hypothetical protein
MLLLDENIDIRFKEALSSAGVFTLLDMDWVGLKNGELREKINEKGFRFLVTADKNLPFQQNLSKVNFCIMVLDSPTLLWEHVSQFAPIVADLMKRDFTQNFHKIIYISLPQFGQSRKKKQFEKNFSNKEILFLI